MAENQIKSEELIQPDVFKDLRDSAAASLPVMKEMSAALQSFLLLTKETVKNNPLGSSEDVKSIGSAYQQVKPAADAYMRVQAQIETAQKKVNETLESNYDELQRHKLAISEVTRETKNAVKAYVAEEGSLDQLRAKLNLATQAYTALSETVRKSQAGLKQLSGIETLRLKIDEVEHSMGNFQRNVGNYKSGYNGLAQSINQLTREAPAAAVSMSTFFLAISNNIPQFTDEIKKLKEANVALEASGKPAVSVLGAIGKAVFSWQTLISVGITLLTLYGSKLIDYIFNTKTATKVTDEFAKSIDDVNKRLAKSNEELEKSNNIAILGDDAGGELNRYAEFLRKKGEINFHYAKLESENRKRLDKESGYRRTDSDLATDLLFTPDKDLAEYIRRKKIIDEGKAKELKNASIIFAQLEQKLEDDKNKTKGAKDKVQKDKEVKERIEKFKTFEEVTNEEYQTQVQSTKDYYERQKNNADIDFINGKITLEQYNETIEKLKLDSLYRQFQDAVDYGQKTVYLEEQISAIKVANIKKQLANEEKTRKDAVLKGTKEGKDAARKAAQFAEETDNKDRIQREKDLYAALQNESNQHYDNELKNIDRQIAAHQKEQDTLRILAAQGVDNAKESLAAEQKAQAEAEEKRAETLRKKQKAEFALTVLKLETANLEANPDNPGKATLDTIAQAAALVSLIEGLPSFFVGTEDTGHGGGLDGKGGFLAINHPHERIVPAHQNLLFGGVSNDEAAKVMSLYNSNQLAPVAYSHDSRDIVRELKNVRETIKTEKSNTFFDYDRITDSFIRVTESKTKLTIDRTKNGGIW